jgi:hypothetical protein
MSADRLKFILDALLQLDPEAVLMFSAYEVTDKGITAVATHDSVDVNLGLLAAAKAGLLDISSRSSQSVPEVVH